ncbi:hypothetical protein J2W37_003697 [Variovorax paradoxus]|uniref:hypothetical protein n=1 Tax=Variovorax paradoxus TaxID=34073 RepID=UPI0027833F70|nr:hypothetical protein [Variovorax paradoxus]MDP9965970.1 hypothetical protein [Variovorax paradoxus]
MKSIANGFLASIVLLVLWRHLIPGGFIFYQGIVAAAIGAFGQCLVQNRRQPRSPYMKDAMVTFLLVYAFVFTVPTTVDRSYSVRMIEHVAAAKGGVSKDEISSMFHLYFSEGGGVERRLEEQLATGTMRREGEGYVASSVGRGMADVFRAVAIVFACGSSK